MSALSDQLKKFLPAAGDDLCDNLSKAAQFELEWIKWLKTIFLEDGSDFTDGFKAAYCALNCDDEGGTSSTTSSTTTSTLPDEGPGSRDWNGGEGVTYNCGQTPTLWYDFSFTVPTGTTSINAKVWGGGGAGGQTYPGESGGGGGGGGEYRVCDIAVTPGEVLTMRVSSGGPVTPQCILVNGVLYPASYQAWNSWQSEIRRGSDILVRANGGSLGAAGSLTTEGVGGAGGTGGSFGTGTSGTSATPGVVGDDAVDCVGGDGGDAGNVYALNVNFNVGEGGVGGSCAGTPTGAFHPGRPGVGGRIEVSWT